ncbi:MAG TPA: Lrp/AsnC family transcriptional regulator [Chromatiales bacterium]|nr:Lrp/AsnC family transcriptional regulator [Chromatiales bacterium]
MVLNETDNRIIAAIQGGLPLTPRPWAEIGRQLGMSEQEVLDRVSALQKQGYIKRMGIVVRHHELGYTANAMVVWDVPDEDVDAVGDALGRQRCVTLCYRRPRRPGWPYNLFSMIHGKDRERVLDYIDQMAAELGLQQVPRQVLFSGRRFKQRGARYR